MNRQNMDKQTEDLPPVFYRDIFEKIAEHTDETTDRALWNTSKCMRSVIRDKLTKLYKEKFNKLRSLSGHYVQF
ncbi:hypothetical protein [Candidatus Cardinium hertigii]|uniref:Uncharacterized protein n=1 Tax=Candidatus Cardinium hertigii TaxID=247481 RepID=A0A2Z3LC75_9BACT|nr:hypothetical protein [Candidatus Cardinium hertigii]AWN81526.1 hypothetical protein DK880_00192 [Candidatus Cardinium hertigii]